MRMPMKENCRFCSLCWRRFFSCTSRISNEQETQVAALAQGDVCLAA